MKTALFQVSNEDDFCGSPAEDIEAPIDATKEQVLELYFNAQFWENEEEHQKIINTNYVVSSDELEISDLS